VSLCYVSTHSLLITIMSHNQHMTADHNNRATEREMMLMWATNPHRSKLPPTSTNINHQTAGQQHDQSPFLTLMGLPDPARRTPTNSPLLS